MSSKSSAKVTTTPAEQPGTALTPIERAKIAINSAEYEKKLSELAKASVSITAITNPAGYDQCHSARMALKKERVEIEKDGKRAREDAQAFSKAVIAEEKRLIGLIEPEETRLERIQRDWDDARRREKEAKEAAERQRVAAIQAHIDEIRQYPLDATDLDSTGVEALIRSVVELVIDDTFAELKQQAEGAKATTLIRLRTAHAKTVAFEAEQMRVASERAENERIRQQNEARSAADRAAAELRNTRMHEIHGIAHQVIVAQNGRLGVRKGGTIECIRDTLAETERWSITQDQFGDLTETAQVAKTDAIKSIRELLTQAEARAAQAAAAVVERQRIADETAALEVRRLAQQEETERQEADLRARAREQAEADARREAEDRRLADARDQLERDQAWLRAERDRPAMVTTIHEGADTREDSVRQARDTPCDALSLPVAPTTSPPSYVYIVFDGPPAATAGRFVEVEDGAGKSISIGEWVERADGLWALRIERQELRIVPSAWMRCVSQPGGPWGPTEYDYELVAGDDQPEGEGWIPLYRKAST